MKTEKISFIIAPFGALAVLCLIAVVLTSGNKIASSADTKIDSQSNQLSFKKGLGDTNNSKLQMQINLPLITNSYFITVIDAKSGESALVSSDQEIVTLKDENGNTRWSTNVVSQVPVLPIFGKQGIRSVEFFNNLLLVRVGKAYVSLDRQTGKMTRCDFR